MLGLNGFSWLLWLTNFLLDNEGGDFHQLFYVAMRASQMYPFLMALHAYWIFYAYPQSQTIENDDYLVG